MKKKKAGVMNEDLVLAKNRIRGSGPQKERFFKFYWMTILDNLRSLLFLFPYFWCQKSTLSLRAPDLDSVRIFTGPDPGWFSESKTSIERLTSKV